MKLNKIMLICSIGISFLGIGCGGSESSKVDQKDILIGLNESSNKDYIELISNYTKEVDVRINKKVDDGIDIPVFEGRVTSDKKGINIPCENNEDDYYEIMAKSGGKESRVTFKATHSKINLRENGFSNWS